MQIVRFLGSFMLTWLLLTTLNANDAEPAPVGISSGADLHAWRALGVDPSPADLLFFLDTHQASPLAELALRQLEEHDLSLPTQNIEPILESLIAHDARLASTPLTVAIAPITVSPLSPDELPALNRPSVASAED